MHNPFENAPPKVELIRYFHAPSDQAASAALTCTNEDLRFSASPQAINRMLPSVYKAGHHTLFQHPHFSFGLSGVSRQFIWAMLHSHPHNTKK